MTVAKSIWHLQEQNQDVQRTKKKYIFKISGSHCSEYEDSLLGYCAVQSRTS
jgi:hypothetical protein